MALALLVPAERGVVEAREELGAQLRALPGLGLGLGIGLGLGFGFGLGSGSGYLSLLCAPSWVALALPRWQLDCSHCRAVPSLSAIPRSHVSRSCVSPRTWSGSASGG